MTKYRIPTEDRRRKFYERRERLKNIKTVESALPPVKHIVPPTCPKCGSDKMIRHPAYYECQGCKQYPSLKSVEYHIRKNNGKEA